MTTPTPDDLTAAHKRTMLIASVVAVVVLLVGVGVAFAVMARRAPKAPVTAFTPVEETSATESVETSASGEATETTKTAVPTLTPNPTPQATSGTATNVRSGKIAYRRTSAIYVSGEDGTGEKLVFNSVAGAFALSADGATLAVMDAPSGGVPQLVLVDVANGTKVRVPGPTEIPTWAPDSSWLAYTVDTAGAFSVRRVNRDGSGDVALLSSAARPRISPDGRSVAYVKSSPTNLGDPLQVYDTAHRTSQTVPNAAGSLDYAWGPDGRLFFARAGVAGGKAVLGVADNTLSHSSIVVSLPTTDTLPSPASLVPSPDGSKVLLAMTGDDGHCDMYVVDIAGKKVKALTTRRDAYPLAWTLDGKAVLYFDGNAIQHETTDLYRMNADGTKHVVVKAGASGP